MYQSQFNSLLVSKKDFLEVAVQAAIELITLLIVIGHGLTKAVLGSELNILGEVVVNAHGNALDTLFDFIAIAAADIGVRCQHVIADISTVSAPIHGLQLYIRSTI